MMRRFSKKVTVPINDKIEEQIALLSKTWQVSKPQAIRIAIMVETDRLSHPRNTPSVAKKH